MIEKARHGAKSTFVFRFAPTTKTSHDHLRFCNSEKEEKSVIALCKSVFATTIGASHSEPRISGTFGLDRKPSWTGDAGRVMPTS